MKPAALEKAEALARHIRYLGATAAEFEVLLTAAEADALLDWLPKSEMFDAEGLPMLLEDIAQARRAHDPFIVLQHFTFSGLRLASAEQLLQ